MTNPLKSDRSTSLGLLLARVPLGVTLLLAGWWKFRGPGGIAGFVSQSSRRVPAYMPAGFGDIYLHAIPFAEVILGLCLLAGFLTRLSGFLAALMLVSFGLAFGLSGFVNADTAIASRLIEAPTVYATFALILFLAGPGKFSVDDALFAGGGGGSSRGRF